MIWFNLYDLLEKRLETERIACAKAICSLCARDVPHRKRPEHSIGGEPSIMVWDLHCVEAAGGVEFRECVAAGIWERNERCPFDA
ncbi:MAG: hypothetical protein ACE5JS_22015 [Nitrospinota bacterium]